MFHTSQYLVAGTTSDREIDAGLFHLIAQRFAGGLLPRAIVVADDDGEVDALVVACLPQELPGAGHVAYRRRQREIFRMKGAT